MQNVAHAYRQAQAGTMGQGEVVVMLFDGALRFLAQAREKMQAKDFAAKGILISKTLDILNELDGSLNMEAGGEISPNLHQLYFMCTTRLLQANLKMDVSLLDSVAEILTGLRSAFAEIMEKPEARAAAAMISAKQAGKQTAATARPLQNHSGTAANPHHANSMYNMQNGITTGMPGQAPSGGGLSEVFMPPLPGLNAAQGQSADVPSPAAMARARAALLKNQAGQQAPAQTICPGPTPGAMTRAQAALSQIQAAQPAPGPDTARVPAPPRPVLTQDMPSVPPPLVNTGGFAGKKLEAYGKLIQRVK